MNQPQDLSRMVPGFEFLQSLMKGAGAGIPGMGQWIAPTLDPAEIDKRIQDLKTVQFWLEQNARLLGTTIQALEVQRMTLSTLQSMNLPLADLHESMKIRSAPAPAPEPAPAPAPAPATPPQAAKPAPPAIDPMQWWGALTQQFTEIAAKAVGEAATGPAAAATTKAASAGSKPKAEVASAARKTAARKRKA